LADKDVGTPGTVGWFTSPEIGVRFEYWNMMRENYALNFSANYGFQNESDEPRSVAPAGTPEAKFSTKSWSVRLGGERVWSPLASTKVFIGPGIEYWMGKAKFEGFPPDPRPRDTENDTRISLHAHMGAIMMVGPTWGYSVQIGQKIGWATYEESGAKTTRWTSSPDGALELVFGFGGGK